MSLKFGQIHPLVSMLTDRVMMEKTMSPMLTDKVMMEKTMSPMLTDRVMMEKTMSPLCLGCFSSVPFHTCR